MELKWNLEPKQLDEFVLNHPNCHYGKTSMWAEVKKIQEHFRPVYVGLWDQGQLQATAVLLCQKKWGVRYAYIPWGPCLDYQNTDLLQAFCHGLRRYAEKNHLAFIRLDPNVRRTLEDGHSNEAITQALIAAGFQHKGYGYGYDGSWSNRYTLMIDITPDYPQIQQRFSSARRSAIKKHNVYCIHTEQADASRLDVLCRLEAILAKEKGFTPHQPEFFQTIMDHFPDHHVYAVSTLDLDQSIEKIDAELQSKKYAKDPEARAAKEKSRHELIELKKKYGHQVEIAAGLFLFANKTSWDLYLYKCSDFNFINGTDEIHQFMIQTMKEHGVERYDMCGFSGSTDPHDPYYGLYLYKSSFGSKIVEHLGEFNFIRQPSAFERFCKADRLWRKVRRKIGYLTHYQKKRTEQS